MRKIQQWMAIPILLSLFFLCSCSGDNGEIIPDTPEEDEQNDDAGETGENKAPAFNGFSIDFATGDFWEYYWITERINVSQGSGSGSTDNGRIRISLGEPQIIAGIEAYTVETTGSNLESYVGPRWSFLASQDNVLFGSTDGNTMDTIFNAQNGEWTGGGFFATFDQGANIQANERTVANEFITTNAVAASYQADQNICEVIAGVRICSDNSFRITVDDFFKAGVGPVGYSYSRRTLDQGGGLTTSSEYYFEIGLVATSLPADDGFLPTLPPWQEKTTLPEPLMHTPIAPWDGKLYVFGGYDTLFNSSRQIYTYDPELDVWAEDGEVPLDVFDNLAGNLTSLGFYEAFVVGNLIYFVRTNSETTSHLIVYDPLNKTWSTGAELVSSVYRYPCYITAVNDSLLFFPIKANTRGEVHILNLATNTWSLGRTNRWVHLDRSSVSSDGQQVFFSGTFRSGSFERRVRVYDLTIPSGPDDAWTEMFFTGEGRADAASQILNDRLYVMGGDNFGPTIRSVEEYDITQGSWKTVGSMLNARQNFNAIALNNKIYAIGGRNGSKYLFSIEEYDPTRDQRSQ